MAFAWASDETSHRATSLAVLRQRFARAELSTRYYTPEIHQAAFALPRFLVEAIEG
jgi:spermidine synthase